MAKKNILGAAQKTKIVILAVAIAIILAFVVGYGINTFYKEPKYEDYCDQTRQYIMPATEAACKAENGTWNNPEPGIGLVLTCDKINNSESYSCMPTADYQKYVGYCNIGERACDTAFRNAQNPYNRNVFIITTILGIIAIVVGVSLTLGSVSSGIMGGGVLTLLYGAIRYWGFAEEWLRFTILIIALLVLIWVGYKKLHK